MEEDSRKPYQSGREVFEHFVRGYSPLTTVGPVAAVSAGVVEHRASIAALDAFFSKVDDLKKSLKK